MTFKLLDVESVTDFLEVIRCQWSAYENPNQTFFRMFCPIRGEGERAREESIQESATRQWEWHTSEPASRWLKVVDDEGKILGASLWKVYHQNPFEKPDNNEAYWIPEGEAREYVTKALEQMDTPIHQMGARPQVYLNILFTHPDHRRRGVADLMIKWGTSKADEMGVEMWLDATAQGMPAYKKHGFVVVVENSLRPAKENPGEIWKRTEEQLQPMVFWTMWRPIGGQYQEGKTVEPWRQV